MFPRKELIGYLDTIMDVSDEAITTVGSTVYEKIHRIGFWSAIQFTCVANRQEV
jgi:hypothetical protein